jgi:hypothetical protein
VRHDGCGKCHDGHQDAQQDGEGAPVSTGIAWRQRERDAHHADGKHDSRRVLEERVAADEPGGIDRTDPGRSDRCAGDQRGERRRNRGPLQLAREESRKDDQSAEQRHADIDAAHAHLASIGFVRAPFSAPRGRP